MVHSVLHIDCVVLYAVTSKGTTHHQSDILFIFFLHCAVMLLCMFHKKV
jgi:hypothetical protein